MSVVFVTGIDTGVGKTVVVGLLARWLGGAATFKLAQTGCEGLSEDILEHRKIMGSQLLPEDQSGLTCPYVFGFPASPHLSSRMEGRTIDPAVLAHAVEKLEQRYPHVVAEGAGGLMVPLTPELTTADFVAGMGWPTVVVTSPKLGSINHTLLTLEALAARKIPLLGLVYNKFGDFDPVIAEESRRVFLTALARSGRPGALVEIANQVEADFSPLGIDR